MKILVPIDFVHPVKATLDLLMSLVDVSTADVKFLYVRELLPAYEHLMESIGTFAEDWDRQLDDRAHKIFGEAMTTAKQHCKSVQTEITSGPVAMMIDTVARDEGYDMTVLTPGPHSPAERLFAGSVTARAVAHLPGTVLVARPQEKGKTDGLSRILIGFDGSKNAKQAIDRAAEVFKLKESSAKITVVYSVDIVDPVKFLTPIEFVSAIEQNMLMQGEAFLAHAEGRLKQAGISSDKIDLCLIEGNPTSELIKMAKETSADLIVMGAQGHSAVERFLLGSVSDKVALHAPCSVAIVKPEKNSNA